jgi:phage gp46-like protein
MDTRLLFDNDFEDSVGAIDGSAVGSPTFENGEFGAQAVLTAADRVNLGDNYNQSSGSFFTFGFNVEIPADNTTQTFIVSKATVAAQWTGWAAYARDPAFGGELRLLLGDGVTTTLATGSEDIRGTGKRSVVCIVGPSAMSMYCDKVLVATESVPSGSYTNLVDLFINGDGDNNNLGDFTISEFFFKSGIIWDQNKIDNWYNQTRHTLNGDRAEIQVNSLTSATSLTGFGALDEIGVANMDGQSLLEAPAAPATVKEFTSAGDIKFYYDGNKPSDIRLADNSLDILRDAGLETSVLISLFSHARAGSDDKLPDKNGTRRGWWADALLEKPMGSKLWLLERAKITDNTRALTEQYTKDALQWMVDDGVADSIEAESRRNGIYRIDTAVKIIKKDNSNVFFRYFLNWQAQIFGGF